MDPLVTLSSAASAFHGYRRNDSVLWGVVWGISGAVMPIIVPVLALAQGYAQPEGKHRNPSLPTGRTSLPSKRRRRRR